MKNIKKYKYWNIEIEGPDKTGKTTLAKYLTQLSNYRFATHDRGFLTQVVYSEKYNRHYHYTMPSKRTVFVLLTCNKEDHKIRCAINNEPYINFDNDMTLFNAAFLKLVDNNYKCFIYNTSEMTVYQIANDIIYKIDMLEKGDVYD